MDTKEKELRAMLVVVPDRVCRGTYQAAVDWKDAVRAANKALAMQDGAKRVRAICLAHIELSAMGGVIRE